MACFRSAVLFPVRASSRLAGIVTPLSLRSCSLHRYKHWLLRSCKSAGLTAASSSRASARNVCLKPGVSGWTILTRLAVQRTLKSHIGVRQGITKSKEQEYKHGNRYDRNLSPGRQARPEGPAGGPVSTGKGVLRE